MTIHYGVHPDRPDAHLYRVRVAIGPSGDSGALLRLPNWIPGSYMIRDFSKSIVEMRATAGGHAVPLEKFDKSSWSIGPGLDAVVIELDVYARDPSVRTAWLDRWRGFFNGTSLFPYVVGREHEPVTLSIERPSHAEGADWTVATTLEAADVDSAGFGDYSAADYDELVDHPVEMSDLQRIDFSACGVPHAMVIAGGAYFDETRLAEDLETICSYHLRFFGDPAPMRRYLFQTALVEQGYGGLEHRASTALMATRESLPVRGLERQAEAYETFLGLCSHEYFHTWIIKRLKPAQFMPYALDAESPTRLLWFFEGITSYYDDLALVRTGLIDHERYLELIGRTVTRVRRGAGRLRQSVTDSSFDAWNKFYKKDENAPNAIVSYYAKGALVALCLDAWIREATDGERSLDTLMRELWRRWLDTGDGLAEDEPERRVAAHAGDAVAERLRQVLYSTDELPVEAALESLGASLSWRVRSDDADKGGKPAEPSADPARPWLGALVAAADGGVRLMEVYSGGPAERAGLSPCDVVVAMEGVRVNAMNLNELLSRHADLDVANVHAFHDGRLFEARLPLEAAEADTAVIEVAVPARIETWLNPPVTTGPAARVPA